MECCVAGKTTLLDLLAGRKRAGKISPQSQILYDGERPTAKYLRRHVGYVEQHDTLLSMMTPYEMLLYTAELKHSRFQSMSEKQAQVMQLIEKLNLTDCKDTVIGSIAKRGISGGEAKRTNIGIALISDPAVLYIDELTSGLDSFTGHEVALAVKTLSGTGITICATLHSPPAYTFELFDRILLLQHGQIVYFGPNGSSSMDYFARTFPQLRGVRQTEGIADFLLDVTTKANKDKVQAAKFIESYSKSDLFQLNMCIIEAKSVKPCRMLEQSDVEARGEGSSPSTFNVASKTDLGYSDGVRTINPMWWALYVMWRHRSLKVYRQPSFIAPRVFDKVMIVFLVVTLWW